MKSQSMLLVCYCHPGCLPSTLSVTVKTLVFRCLPGQFPVLSYGTSLGTKNGGMGTHTVEVSNYKEKQSFVIYREMDATWR